MSDAKFPPQVVRVSVIMLLMVLGSFAVSDMYLPAFPAIKQVFAITTDQTQLTVSVYFFGSMFCLLFAGPLSDRFGRKKVLMSGLFVMNIGLLISCLSQTYHQFLLSRLIEGLAAGAILSGMRTVFKDIIKGERLALLYSYLSIVVALGPALSPVFGGVITSVYSWRLIFILSLCFFFVLFFLAWFKLPETLSVALQKENRREKVLSHAAQACQSFPFLCYTIGVACLYGAYMAYITASPIIIQVHMRYTAAEYGGITLIALMLGQASKIYNVFYLEKKGSRFMIRLGCVFMGVGGALLMLGAFLHYYSLISLLLPMVLVLNGGSIIMPSVSSRALNLFGNIVGMAATIYSIVFMLGATLGSAVMSRLSEQTLLPLAVIVLIATCFSIVSFMFALRLDKQAA